MDEMLNRILACMGPTHGAGKALAEHLGVSPNVVTNWKNGSLHSYRKYVDKIAAFYGVSADYLRGETEERSGSVVKDAAGDEFIAFYGSVKEDLTEDDLDDIRVAMQAKAERNRKRKTGE